MTLLNSEQVLFRLDTGDGELVLTSHRVVHGWQTKFTSINLDEVGSVAVAPLTQRWMLVVVLTCAEIAACLVAMGVKHGDLQPLDVHHLQASALLFLGAFLVVTFGVRRFSRVQISSPGDTIGFRIPSVIRKDIHRFLVHLEHVRRARRGAVVPTPAARQRVPTGFRTPSVGREDIHQLLPNLGRVLTEWHSKSVRTAVAAFKRGLHRRRVPAGRRVYAGQQLEPLETATYRQDALEIATYKQDMERRIRAGEAWLSATLRCIGDGVIATSREGEIVFVNPVAERLTGWSAAQAQGRGLLEVLSLREELPRRPATSPAFNPAGAEPQAYRLISKAGARSAVTVECFENRSADEILGSIVVVREIPVA